MKFSEKIKIIINRMDKYHGCYRYYIGKHRIGIFEEYKDIKNIYYLMVPTFGNVGDEAIVESTILYFSDAFPDYNLVVVNYLDTLQTLQEIERIIKKDDLIVLQGGGNIGTLYYDAERMREFIIKKFSNIKIISMPQSMYFDSTIGGVKKYKRCKRIYNTHPSLTLIAREKYTYEDMKKAFPKCKVLLNPDIVFYLSKEIHENRNIMRSGIMTCLRTDKEDVLGSQRNVLINTLAEKYDDFIISDTCVPRNIPEEIRYNEIFSLVNQFKRIGLVITDRLHGMVLSALTNTPCLVIPSIDAKVLGTYEWIQDISFIRFLENYDISTIISNADEMMRTRYEPFDWNTFRDKHFNNLRIRIEDCI